MPALLLLAAIGAVFAALSYATIKWGVTPGSSHPIASWLPPSALAEPSHIGRLTGGLDSTPPSSARGAQAAG